MSANACRAALVLIMLTCFCCLQTVTTAQRAYPDALRRDIERARDRVYPAVVNILTVTRYFSEDGRNVPPRAAVGSSSRRRDTC